MGSRADKKANFLKVSKVQSGQCPTLRNIVQTALCGGIVTGQQMGTLNPDTIPMEYRQLSFVDKMKMYDQLTKWYADNREVVERVKQGDYTDFLDPNEPAEPVESAQS